MSEIELTALNGHHPLGFLAACGLLRCCEGWGALRSVALSWGAKHPGGEFTAVLHTSTSVDIKNLTQVLVCRSKQQRESPALNWSTKIDDRDEFRKQAKRLLSQPWQESRHSLEMLGALASDAVTTDKGALRPTMFDLTSGNQHLLKNIRVLAGEPKEKKGKSRPFTEDGVREALLGPWLYQDEEHSLGWDPQTQRLHSLRNRAPTGDKQKLSVRIAVFLASQALPLFPCFAVGSRLSTTAFHSDAGDDWFAWPIWHHPISIDVLRSLLAHPFSIELRKRGVEIVYRCRRSHTGGSEGDYHVFSNAQQRLWPHEPRKKGAGRLEKGHR